MTKRKWSFSVIIRYFLLQLPGIGVFSAVVVLSYYVEFLPSWLAWTLWTVWMLKDIFFYPLVWQAYDPAVQKAKNSLIGKSGVTTEKLNPQGYVDVNGESWKAEVEEGLAPIGQGKPVVILRMEGLTLIVKPEEQ
jgi:membrane protein implicated in regulation of membrane protease activity